MRLNQPVTTTEYPLPGNELLMSTTDSRGVITHCNAAFCRVSGFSMEELIGQPHNKVRHPDMPPEAFADMWATVGRGRSWTGIVKNRRKNGDYYWVRASVTPIMENGKPKGYMSVRCKAEHEEVRAAVALYDRLRHEREAGRSTFRLHGGRVRHTGWRDWLGKLHRATLTQRLGAMVAGLVAVALLPTVVPLPGTGSLLSWHTALVAALAVLVVVRFDRCMTQTWKEANLLARDIAGCNLETPIEYAQRRHPMGQLTERLRQIQLNLRAVVGDARVEIGSFGNISAELAHGANDLAARTDAQAASLEQTAASMEELAATVRQSLDTVQEVLVESNRSASLAQDGGDAVGQVDAAMRAIEQSSRQMAQIIEVIEGIAAQTNILALNAAVEAARAGEQGRGFAIVANEVRALAQRSADAAQQIRRLIGQSGTQVGHGVQQMASVASVIEQVVASVAHVNELMGQIDLAANEQNTGIEQVNQAVASLDKVTQQNATLVEASVASAEQMNRNAGVLGRTLAVFRL
ncbi:PAS domain-containing methyl-accepting chemotaxis protein [Corticimicrobacter populi]|uniref:Chemotaxis protein n=1 Tax=Corticimicrobacter populi TaxID=2175229 RepID=A0A2V1JWH4_9BURK|nr:PAS domain-containing methyl-accepting chemotaxis protein [Corticimicrobacter populi]PWF21059.1 chemotaxis protein [Corticimicrobacter populi]